MWARRYRPGRNPIRAFPFHLSTCRPGKLSPATSRPRNPGFVPGDSGKCCSVYNFNNTNAPDPDINPAFLPKLQSLCPNGGDGSRRVALDTGSVNSFGSSFYENLRSGRGVVESDAKLWSDQRTQRLVQGFLGANGARFNAEFGRAMVRLGNVEVKTGTQGEIRRVLWLEEKLDQQEEEHVRREAALKKEFEDQRKEDRLNGKGSLRNFKIL
ncbi:peroxidase N1-like protein [Tanacetum coccineum]